MENNYDISVPFGSLRLGKIISYDLARGLAKVELANSQEITSKKMVVSINIPVGVYSNDGIFVGSLAQINTPVVVARGEGTNWHFVTFIPNNPAKLPSLIPGQLLLRSNNLTKITLDLENNINIGSTNNKINIDTKNNLISDNFDNKFSFTEASRQVNGIIKRDLSPIKDFPQSLKLTSNNYHDKLLTISLDPKASSSFSFLDKIKNPPFVEQREIVYEFAYSADIQDDLTEEQLYRKSGTKSTKYLLPNRRQSRSDTLSLSLVAPNFLMETVKGTVVDIFGNILDLNRFPIPIGSKNLTLKTTEDNGNIQSDMFLNIKEAERKSIAFHFELNARKDLKNKTGITLPDVNSKDDYARNRSRFFFDIDKEGQFKLNVPASSEKGNIPLLTRYENYSTVGTEDENNPNKLFFREDELDILHDSFAVGTINIKNESNFTSLNDRIDNVPIKHGTAYHSITDNFFIFQPSTSSQFTDYQYNNTIDLASLPSYDSFVSRTIDLSQNIAGGRSGSISLDGSLELNIGANTIDRQSLWLDTAGSLIAMLGRDNNNISAALSLDGDLVIQVGGNGISSDSRFKNKNNGYRGGAVDIRVVHDGFTTTVVRIDNLGVKISTPSTLALKARDINISAEGQLVLDGDEVIINDRLVHKYPATSI